VCTTFGGGAGTPAERKAQWFNDAGVEPYLSGGAGITSDGGVGLLGAVSAGRYAPRSTLMRTPVGTHHRQMWCVLSGYPLAIR
jgi:hypothetical protein